MTHINRNATISLLDWPDSSRLREPTISHPKLRQPAKVPALRIVSDVPRGGLFKYATAAKSETGFWETIVYAALALATIGALALAFGI